MPDFFEDFKNFCFLIIEMQKPYVDYEDIDEGIRDIIRILNAVPFLSTIGSCEGHLRDYVCHKDEPWKPERGYLFLVPGDVGFWIDEGHPKSGDFLEDLERMLQKYPVASLKIHNCDEQDCSIKGSYFLKFTWLDLTSDKESSDNDPLEATMRKNFQVKIEDGERRLAEYRQVWKELSEIAAKYVG